METKGPVQVKDIIIEKFNKLGYKKEQKIVETLNGPKEITEYTKSFLTYSFINPQGSGEYPLLLSIDFTKENEVYGSITRAKEFIFQALADNLIFSREKYDPETEPEERKKYNKFNGTLYHQDEKSLIVDTNLEGVEYMEVVLEKLQVPFFQFKANELLKGTVQGRLLQELGFEISSGKQNDLLVGDKRYIHVVHAPIEAGTPGKETYVNHEWKIKIDAYALLADKKNIKKYNEIIKKHGLQSYKKGNSFIETRPFPLETSSLKEFIVSRVNIPGLVEISKLFDPSPGKK